MLTFIIPDAADASSSTDAFGRDRLVRFAALNGQDRIVMGNLARVVPRRAAASYNIIDFDFDPVPGVPVYRMFSNLPALFDILAFRFHKSKVPIGSIDIY
jgi:hypothetical protein